MEARVLHSADLSPLGWSAPAALHDSTPNAAPAATATPGHEIVFIDASLPDAQGLIADLRAQQSGGRLIEIVTIAAGQDGLALISHTLSGRQDITAVHVLAHGSDGQLRLGSSLLDSQALVRRAGELAAWSDALTADADLLLYGCDLARGPAGRQLLQDLGALTGADVAASVDLTGAAARGGDWALEARIGHIETSLAPSAREQARWQGVLTTYTVTTTADVIGANLLPGTLRWAISQANAHAGVDTIVFAVDGTFNLSALSSGDDNNATGDLDITDSVNLVGNGSGKTVINGNGLDRVFDVRAGTVSMSGLTIQGGASNEGAGLQVDKSATLSLTDAVVQNNIGKGGSKGGGIYTEGALTLRRTVVQNNGNATSGDIDGAGIYVAKGAGLDAVDVEIRGNVAADKHGGGVYIASSSAGETLVSLQNVTLAGNRADKGGGLWNAATGTTLVNVTLSGNHAVDEGGGLWTDHAITLDHVTVAYNSLGDDAGTGAGVLDDKGGLVTVKSSLFASNAGGNTNRALVSRGYNLSDDNSAGFTATGDLKNVAAGIGSLAYNGGFTRTISIGAGSQARDGANPATTLTADQRGVAYFAGRADIGAFEYNPYGFVPTISAPADQTIDEDGTLGPIAFTVSDSETSADDLVVTASSSNGALLPDANIVIGGSGTNRTISLTPAANASGGPITITLTVSDGGNSVSTTFQLTVRAVNDAPTVTLPGAQSVNEDGSLTLAGANAPSVGDADAGSAPVQVTLAVAHGTLSLSQTSGLTFVIGNGTNNATMTFNGTQAAVNAALDGMQYRPTADYLGSDQLDLSINDLGNDGSGGARTASGSLAIAVQAVNDAPALALPGAQATPLLNPLSFSAATGNAITLADVDAGSAQLQITLSTANAFGNGTISFGSLAGLTVVSGTGSNDSTIVLRGTAADLNAALDTLSFTATAAGPAQLDVLVDDLGNSGSGEALEASGAVTITVGNDALPVLTLGRNTGTFTEGDGSIRLDPSLTLSDSDNPTLASAQVRFVGDYAGAQDLLSFVNDGSTMGNITASYSAGVLTLTSAGQTATLAEWEAALRAVTYSNDSDAPDTSQRTLMLTVNDGIADSPARQFVLSVVAVNDAPVLGGSNDLAATVEDASENQVTLVSSVLAGHVADADADGKVGIAIVAVDNNHGTWQYTTDGGATWTDIGNVSNGSALLLSASPDNGLRFVPDPDWNGTVTGGLRWCAWDQSSGSEAGRGDTRTNGGDSAFSSTTVASSITVTAVNDAPVAANPIGSQSATEDRPFSFTLPWNRFTDVDTGDTLQYAATLANGADLPSWLHFDATTRTFSGTPDNTQVGTLALRITVTDDQGS
ncbi:MAG: DUF4347 domain-containing protein, partial [Vitreoscilla sp.]|nr:DUF4347 domain-containing protein [Vitreoscilla sp.]